MSKQELQQTECGLLTEAIPTLKALPCLVILHAMASFPTLCHLLAFWRKLLPYSLYGQSIHNLVNDKRIYSTPALREKKTEEYKTIAPYWQFMFLTLYSKTFNDKIKGCTYGLTKIVKLKLFLIINANNNSFEFIKCFPSIGTTIVIN